MKIHSAVLVLLHVDRWTDIQQSDMAKTTGIFLQLLVLNTPKNTGEEEGIEMFPGMKCGRFTQ
jgi:hypothetical protein